VAAKMSQRPTGTGLKRTGAARPTKTRDATLEPSVASEAVPVDFGPLSQYLGYYLRRLYDSYRKHFVAQAGDLNVQPREVGALFAIALNPGLTPSQLSVALALDGAQITAMLNTFDARGFVERRVSVADARSRLVYLTPAGRKMLDRLRKVVGAFDRSFAGDSLTDEELGQLIGLLAKLHAGTGD
jgi:DNA-binding MarR family transcriptional regulator